MSDPGYKPSNTTPRSMRVKFAHYLTKMRRYYDEANQITEQFTSDPKYTSPRLAEIAASEDFLWRTAVANQQFMERLSNTYGIAAQVELLEAILAEQRRTNELLTKIYNEKH